MSRFGQSASHRPTLPAWKFEPPVLPERSLPRKRLVAKLEECLGKTRSTGDVFLVSAPAGYGKTTLIAQWAAQTRVRVAWYHLDASDNDPAVLLSGIVRALHKCLPRTEWHVESLLRRLRDGVVSPQDMTRAANLVARDMHDQVVRPLALVITGLSALSPKGEGHATLDRLLLRPPDQVRLVLETTEAPRLRLSSLMMQRRLDGVGIEDLRLHDAEAAELIALIGSRLDEQQTERLRMLCEGWITGILLATNALTPSFLLPTSGEALDRAAIFDYLSARVIDALPPSLRDFAIQSAILDHMTPQLCAQLLNLPDAQEARGRLAALEKRTGFVTRSGRRPGNPTYRFQPLLRQALLDHLEREPDGSERRLALHFWAGELLEQRGDDEAAIQQYAQAGAFERIVTLIEARRGSLLRAGRGATLARWLAFLPDKIRRERPHLQILLAEMHRLAGRTSEALAVAEQACRVCLPQAASNPTLAARALIARSQVRFIQGSYAQAQADAEEALRLAPDDADELHVSADFVRVACYAVLGNVEAAEARLDAIEPRAGQIRDLWALSRLHYLRSKLLLERNAYVDAEAQARTGLMYAQEAENEVDAASIRLNLGAVRYRTGNLVEAREEFEAARSQAAEAGIRQIEAYALAHLGEVALYQGQLDTARGYFDETMAVAEAVGDAYIKAWAYRGLGLTSALQGQGDQAVSLLVPALQQYEDETLAVERGMLQVALGYAQIQAGRLSTAETLLTQACASFEAHGLHFEHACARLYLAEALFGQALDDRARMALTRALDMASGANAQRLITLEALRLPRVQASLGELKHPLAEQIVVELADTPVERAAETATSQITLSDATTDEQVHQIRVFALGTPRVLRGGELVRWRLPAARELFFYLLEHGGSARKDEIIAALWPDKDGEAASNAFRAARFHLKEALGRPCLLQVDNCWTLTVECGVDVREFEEAAAAGERFAEMSEITNAVSMLRLALTYRTGQYLADIYNDWATLRREQLQERYLVCLERLAELEMQLSHPEQAAQIYYEIIDTVPHRESAYRGLMNYFVLRDEPAEAVNQFQRCINVLHDELGITPGPKTLTLYQAIIDRLDSSTHRFLRSYQ